MDDKLNVESAGLGINIEPKETEEQSYEEIQTEVEQIAEEQEEVLVEEYETVTLTEEEDLNKKNYTKITPTLYIQYVGGEEEDVELELFKVLNPETGVAEKRLLTDDEKREVYIHELKQSRKSFNPIRHNGNVTTNKYGSNYKQKRKKKNKQAKKSRRANR